MAQLLHMLQGRYLPRRIVGAGGYGKVLKADDTYLQRVVALKEIPLTPETALYPSRDPLHEARMLSILEHSQIPAVHDVFFEQGFYYIAMQWIEGERLDLYRQKMGSTYKPFPIDSFFSISLQLCKILRFLHERECPIIYRDLKPRNLLITQGITQEGKLYMVDMGGAKFLAEGNSYDDDSCFSLGYVAPEIEKGTAASSIVTDIYSLSVTLYELLANRRMIWLDGEAQIAWPAIPALEDLLRRGTACNPAHRPQTVREIENVLIRLRKQLQINPQIIIDRDNASPLLYSYDSCPYSL